MQDRISHKGVIQSVSSQCVEVRIIQSSACSACAVAKHCNASDTSVKMVEVRGYDRWQSLTVGQEVTVWASRRVAGLALSLGFLTPLILMLSVIAVIYFTGGSELTAALSGLGALIPYYILLYVMRGTISGKVEFHIEE